MSLSVRLRFEVLKRDGFRCAYCGITAEARDLQVDHIIPVASGGLDELPNLITACRDCNQGKSDKPLTAAAPSVSGEVVAELAERVGRAQRYASLVVADRKLRDDQVNTVRAAWGRAYGARDDGEYLHLDGGQFPEKRSVGTILERLPLHRVLEFVDAMPARFPWPSADASRYFYGMCWRAIKGGEAERRVGELEAALIESQRANLRLTTQVEEMQDRLDDANDRLDAWKRHECGAPRLATPVKVSEILRGMG